jgi:hypothetical protein
MTDGVIMNKDERPTMNATTVRRKTWLGAAAASTLLIAGVAFSFDGPNDLTIPVRVAEPKQHS